jgi:hypothetical protein
MSAKRLDALSALSGCAWAGIAYLIGRTALGPILVGGLIASPLIGLVAGRLYRPAYALPTIGRAFAALATFYVAVALFGLAVGLYDAFTFGDPHRIRSAVVIQAILGTLWGVTFTGYLTVLWPLAYLNHWLVGRLSGASG